MRISPINSIKRQILPNRVINKQEVSSFSPYTQEQKLSVLEDKNYSQLLINKPIAFKGVSGNPNDILNLVNLIPLEEKIAAMFQKYRRGEMIIVASELNQAQKLIKNSIKEIEELIKKVHFIKESDFKGCLVFVKNVNGLNEIWNFNKEPIVLNNTDMLKSGESYFVAQGDVLIFNDQHIFVKERPTAKNALRPNNIGSFAHLFTKTYDFSKDTASCIERENKKHISTLVKSAKSVYKRLSFADVGGQSEIIDHLKKNILFPIKYPDVYEDFPINHGTILYGPPGTGKSLIAEAIANESNATYKKLNGLELESKWVGESEENWRNLFNEAIDNQPSIVFIDEFDAVARTRTGRNEYGDNVVNQILTLMSDLEKSGDQVFIITATNNYEALDPAIKRPGRFGHHLEVKLPDLEGTKHIINIHVGRKPLAKDVNLDEIAEKMFAKKMSGADIAHVVTTAHTNAFERLGIYAKMDAGTMTPTIAKRIKINAEDFNKAITEFVSNNNTRKPVGFKRESAVKS